MYLCLLQYLNFSEAFVEILHCLLDIVATASIHVESHTGRIVSRIWTLYPSNRPKYGRNRRWCTDEWTEKGDLWEETSLASPTSPASPLEGPETTIPNRSGYRAHNGSAIDQAPLRPSTSLVLPYIRFPPFLDQLSNALAFWSHPQIIDCIHARRGICRCPVHLFLHGGREQSTFSKNRKNY